MTKTQAVIEYLCNKILEELHGTELHPDSLNKAIEYIDRVRNMMDDDYNETRNKMPLNKVHGQVD